MYDDDTEYPDGSGGHMLLLATCICCGNMATGHPDTIPSVFVHPQTRSPLRPNNGGQVAPGDPDAVKEPVCPRCEAVIRSYDGQAMPLREVFRGARIDLINPPATR